MAKRPPQLVAALKLAKQGHKDLDHKIEALVAQYVRAEADIAGKALLALASGKLGFLKFRKTRVAEVRQILVVLTAHTKPRSRHIVKESFRLGTRVAQKGGAESGFSKVNQEAVNALLENLDGRLEAATTIVGRRVEDVFRREGLKLAAAQLAEERSPEDATRELVRQLGESGVTAFVDKAGKKWGLESYARMAIRTVTSEAQFVGTETTMLSRGFDLAEVNQVDQPCDTYCVRWDGKTVSLSGRSDKYPQSPTFPLHPNCRHFITMSPLALEERDRVAA